LILTTHENAKIERPNKASLCFQVSNEVGALAKVLNIFAAGKREHEQNTEHAGFG
jgi:prephenate dehydratase